MNQIGVLSQFSPQESRNIEPVRGIGFGDQIAELVPSVTEPLTADFERALCYLANLWQAFGYASGTSGPVRSLRHHRWPFDVEMQIVFSTLADMDLGVGNTGMSGAGTFSGGLTRVSYPKTTMSQQATDSGLDTGNLGHSALITVYEACWFNNASTTNIAKDSGMLMESGSVTVTDVHDFASQYGEFLPTGNDPSIGQLGSVRFQTGRQAAFGGVNQGLA